MNSSKATNVLLAIIAVALIAIALKPADLMPTAAAQLRPDTREDAAGRFTAITATDKAVQQQTQAIAGIATAIGRLADSGDSIAKAIEDVSRSLTNLSDRLAESAAGRVSRTP